MARVGGLAFGRTGDLFGDFLREGTDSAVFVGRVVVIFVAIVQSEQDGVILAVDAADGRFMAFDGRVVIFLDHIDFADGGLFATVVLFVSWCADSYVIHIFLCV